MPDSKHRFHRAMALLGCAGLTAPAFAVNIDFTNQGTITTPQLDQSDLHITAQSSPGVAEDSPALISFGGDLTLAPSASLNIELTGPARGTQYDAIDVAGKLALDGTLNLSRPNAYDPAYLFPHLILHAAERDGTFDAITGITVSSTKWLAVTYTSDSVLVTAALPGDANLDGTVNFSDFVALSNHFGGAGAGWAGGDFNADGTTNFSDFVVLSNSFGTTVGGERAGSPAAGVPEPATLILISLSLPLLSRRRRSLRSIAASPKAR